MTKQEWLQLQPRDIIVEVKSGRERMILSVAHAITPRGIRTSITLKKLTKNGWTPKKTTTYSNNDDRGRWRLKRC